MSKPIVFFVVLFCLVGCRHMEYVPTTSTEVRYVDRYNHDSTFIDRYHIVEIMGDTIWIRDSVSMWRDKVIHDTAVSVIRDSIAYPVEVERVVNKYPLWPLDATCIVGCMAFLIIKIWRVRR